MIGPLIDECWDLRENRKSHSREESIQVSHPGSHSPFTPLGFMNNQFVEVTLRTEFRPQRKGV